MSDGKKRGFEDAPLEVFSSSVVNDIDGVVLVSKVGSIPIVFVISSSACFEPPQPAFRLCNSMSQEHALPEEDETWLA